MSEHSTSDMATYRSNGTSIYDVFFLKVFLQESEALYGFKSPKDREIWLNKVISEFKPDSDILSYTSPHKIGGMAAFKAISEGIPAFYNFGDIPEEDVWTPLFLNNKSMGMTH